MTEPSVSRPDIEGLRHVANGMPTKLQRQQMIEVEIPKLCAYASHLERLLKLAMAITDVYASGSDDEHVEVWREAVEAFDAASEPLRETLLND